MHPYRFLATEMKTSEQPEFILRKIMTLRPASYVEKSTSLVGVPSCRFPSTTPKYYKKKKATSFWWLPWLMQQQEPNAIDSRTIRISHPPSRLQPTTDLTTTIWVASQATMMAVATTIMAHGIAVKVAISAEYGLTVTHLTLWLGLIIYIIIRLIMSFTYDSISIIHHHQEVASPATITPARTQVVSSPRTLPASYWPPFIQSCIISNALLDGPCFEPSSTTNNRRQSHVIAKIWEQHEQSLEQYRQMFPVRPTERRRCYRQQRSNQRIKDGNDEEVLFNRANEQLVNFAKEALAYFEYAYSISPDEHRDNMINVLRAYAK